MRSAAHLTRISRRAASAHRVCAVAVLVAMLVPGCRSDADSKEPETGQAAETDARTTAQREADARPETPPASEPATQASAPLPPDPNGCLAAGCHASLAQVPYRHGPLQAGACEVCHEDEQPEHKFPLKRPQPDLCTFCHPVIGHKDHLHEVIATEGCLPCHDPHGSNTKFLLPAASIELTCQQCHQIERKRHLHGPFAGGQCSACHQPHESDNESLLIGGGGKSHCLVCHTDKQRQLLAASTIHKPLEGACTDCHTPHSSENAQLLTAPMEELCFQCHPYVKEEVAGAKMPHGAVFTGHRCANCHDPHAAERPSLLKKDLRTLCLSCHDKPVEAYDGRTIPDMRPALTDRKSLHGPVRTGECSTCHDVHGGRNARLLKNYFPPEFYQPFDLANYALCFQCHSSAIVLEPETATLTDFRDGARNLHHVHVNRPEKGRTCRTCHEIHGSDLPRHMASEVQFEGGGWSMPIRFTKTTTGGRCSPGCHEPKDYDRNRPRNAATRAAVEVPQ